MAWFDQLLTNIKDLAGAVAADVKGIMPRLVPAGGTAGQVYTKQSATDYHAIWQSLPSMPKTVVLGSDVSGSTTFSTVTGLSFELKANTLYYFKFVTLFDVNSTSTGSGWGIAGPTASVISWVTRVPSVTTGASTETSFNAYTTSAVMANSNFQASNRTEMEGFVKPTVDGTLIVRFAAENTTSAAITAKAGSFGELKVIG